MQDIILWIIISLCVIWAGAMVYRRMNNRGKNPCGECSLRDSCNEKGNYLRTHSGAQTTPSERCAHHVHHHRHHHG